jgi:hypothetical protein
MEIPGKHLGKCGGSWENRERFFSFLNWDIIDKKGGKVCITRQRVRKLKKDVKMK